MSNEESMLRLLKALNIEFIALAGFMQLIPSFLVLEYSNRIINIHPALLPKYGGKGMYGIKVHEAVLAAKETESGITIHCVNEHYDEGKVILQAKTAIEETDTPESLSARVRQLEHWHYPRVIEKVLS